MSAETTSYFHTTPAGKKQARLPFRNKSALWLFISPKSTHLLPLARTGFLGAPSRYSQYSDSFWQVGKYLSKALMCTGRIYLDVRFL